MEKYNENQSKPMEIKYNVPIEVSKTQFEKLRVQAAGWIAFKEHQGKFFIKVFFMCYKKEINNIIVKYQ